MARITGVGGIFFKCDDPKSLAAWYRDVLGFPVQDWGGAVFEGEDHPSAQFVWSPFAADSDHFAPSKREFMINLAVDDLDGMVEMLSRKGVEIIGRSDDDTFGKFAWLMDPAGTKIELWQSK